ncbi:hypothetical protein C8R47DRAFT_1278228 [Mycena vitilis]|nr:hypothetical protein C8R47DRAFT_1278228 [Mycena vitilis]
MDIQICDSTHHFSFNEFISELAHFGAREAPDPFSAVTTKFQAPGVIKFGRENQHFLSTQNCLRLSITVVRARMRITIIVDNHHVSALSRRTSVCSKLTTKTNSLFSPGPGKTAASSRAPQMAGTWTVANGEDHQSNSSCGHGAPRDGGITCRKPIHTRYRNKYHPSRPSTLMSTPPRPQWTPAEDKALKLEAMRSAGCPDTPQLKAWLDHYRPPPTQPTQRFAALVARVTARKHSVKKIDSGEPDLPERKTDFHERKFAALVARVAARKQRVDNVVALRTRAIKSSEHVWPPPRCHRRHKENIRHREIMREEEEARRAAELARERAAREERVALLMRLREAGNGTSSKWGDQIKMWRGKSSPQKHSRVLWSILPAAMNAPTLPTDVWLEIAKLCPLSTRLEIVQVNSTLWFHVVGLVYRNVFVGARAMKFVHTLATNSKLPGLVKVLEFEESAETAVDPGEWALVLPAMKRLGWLMVCSTVPCPPNIVPSITFRLWAFGSYSSIIGSWIDLIASQSGLRELLFWSEYYGPTPGADKLPLLRSIRGRPADVARFAHAHPLLDIWFFVPPFGPGQSLKRADLDRFASSDTRLVTVRMRPSQFMTLFRAAPRVLTSLSHIVLEEELAWSDFTDGSVLASLFATLDDRFPSLRSVCLAFYSFAFNCTRTRRLLNRADGAYFARLLVPLHRAPLLNALRIFAADGCASYDNWGTPNEVVSYEDRKVGPEELTDIGPVAFEVEYTFILTSILETESGTKCTGANIPRGIILYQTAPMSRLHMASPNFVAGRAEAPETSAVCSRCTQSNPTYQCQNCRDILCRACIIRTDAHLLHQLQRVFAWQLGQRLRLMHGPDASCPTCILQPGFRVFSVSGMVEIDVEFCGCDQAPSRSLQLLAARLIPLQRGSPTSAAELGLIALLQGGRYLAPRPAVKAPEPPKIRNRRSVPCPQEIAKENKTYFNPVAEAQWQSWMAELPAIVREWAESSKNKESSDDDGSVDESVAALEADRSDTLDAALQRRIAIDPRYQLHADGQQMEDISRREMERDREEALRRRRWAGEEMRRRVRAEREERANSWESAVAAAVGGMREPERRSWLDEQARQEGRYGAPWQVRIQQRRAGAREMGPGDDSWGRGASEGASGSWVDYSTLSARYVESTRRQAGWTEELVD